MSWQQLLWLPTASHDSQELCLNLATLITICERIDQPTIRYYFKHMHFPIKACAENRSTSKPWAIFANPQSNGSKFSAFCYFYEGFLQSGAGDAPVANADLLPLLIHA
jgi:hypothetical protein